MQIRVKLEPRTGLCSAEGIYCNGILTVLSGGRINLDFAEHIRGGKTAMRYRDSSEYVDNCGIILKDCEFKSPSTAAQFVTGRSTNGYEAWRLNDGKQLGVYLKENGLRA